MVRTGLILCLVAIATGPLYSESFYNPVSHSVSELAAQGARNAWVMRLGLAALGVSTIIGFIRKPNHLNVCFLAFGVFILLAAVFPHKPIPADQPYSEVLDLLHSVFSGLGGFSAVMGFTLLGINMPGIKRKCLYFCVAISYTLLPVMMFTWPAYQGVFQRLLFGSFILWALLEYPVSIPSFAGIKSTQN